MRVVLHETFWKSRFKVGKIKFSKRRNYFQRHKNGKKKFDKTELTHALLSYAHITQKVKRKSLTLIKSQIDP